MVPHKTSGLSPAISKYILQTKSCPSHFKQITTKIAAYSYGGNHHSKVEENFF